MTRLTQKDRAITEEAAYWAITLDAGTLPTNQRESFAQWLAESPQHVKEVLMTAATLEACGDVENIERLSLSSLLEEKAPEVISLYEQMQARKGKESPVPKRQSGGWWKVAAGIALLAIGSAALLQMQTDLMGWRTASDDYITIKGEQRSLTLDDGTMMHLNTASHVQVRYTGRERAITLMSGEALFEVAKESGRPFRVYTGETVTEALGTAFNIYLNKGKTTVAVVDGKVQVAPLAPKAAVEAKAKPAVLGAGDIATYAGEALTLAKARNINAYTSWRQHKLVFESEPLANIVWEFNRYNKVQIALEDDALAGLEFNGVFNANNPEAFTKFLGLSGSFTITRTEDGIIHLKGKG